MLHLDSFPIDATPHPASQHPRQGASGVTVFGDIAANVTRERTR